MFNSRLTIFVLALGFVIGGFTNCLAQRGSKKIAEETAVNAGDPYIAFAVVLRVDTKMDGLAPPANKESNRIGKDSTWYFSINPVVNAEEDADSIRKVRATSLRKSIAKKIGPIHSHSFFDVWTEVSLSGSQDDGDAAVEPSNSMTLNYEEVKWTYKSGGRGSRVGDIVTELMYEALE